MPPFKNWLIKKIIVNQAPICIFLEDIPSKIFSGLFFRLNLWALNGLDRFSPAAAVEMQNLRLRWVIKRAYNNVPFWRHRFDNLGLNCENIRTLSDLQKIPILTRDEIQEVFDNDPKTMIDQTLSENRLIFATSSGSTGKRTFIVFDKRHAPFNRGLHFHWLCKRCHIDSKNIEPIIFFVPEVNKHARYFKFASADPFSDMNKLYDYLKKNEPIILGAPPHDLLRIAKTFQAENWDIKFRGLFSSTASLFREEAKLLKSVFSAPVFNFYGAKETFFIASECFQKQGLHIAPRVIVEIIDDSGKPVPDGIFGNIIVTVLDNFAMPIIRYKVGDRGRILPKKCYCNITSPLLEFGGRGSWYFILPDGRKVLEYHVKELVINPSVWFKIKQFQFVQESKSSIELYIVPDENWDKEAEKNIESARNHASFRLLKGADLKIILCDSVPYKSEKPKEFVSRIMP